MKQGSLVVDPYAGQPGQLRLTPTPRARIIAANPGIGEDELKEAGVGPEKDPDAEAAPSHVSGIFDLQVVRVNSSRNLANPELNYCNLTVLVRWEPRIRPISIDLPASTIKAIDEYDNPIDVPNPDQVMSGIVQPEIPELEFSIPIGLVDRQIEVINSFEATIDAVLPGRTETFRFKKIGKLKAGNQQSKAGAIVTFGGIQKRTKRSGISSRLGVQQPRLSRRRRWQETRSDRLRNASTRQIRDFDSVLLRKRSARHDVGLSNGGSDCGSANQGSAQSYSVAMIFSGLIRCLQKPKSPSHSCCCCACPVQRPRRRILTAKT
jgi:hypothetical protein